MPTNKPRPADPCPLCMIQTGIIEPLQFQPGSKTNHFCLKGHDYPDRDQLQELMKQALPLKQKLVVQQATIIQPVGSAPPAPEPSPATHDFTVVEGPAETPTDGQPLILTHVGDKVISIGPLDFARIAGIIGHFTDSSSLFGAIYALQQQLADERELRQRVDDAKKIGTIHKIGGDMPVEIVVPERHVEPVKDIAEANQMDITRYVNAMVEHALDNGWFF